MSDEQKEADVTDYLEGLSVTERAAAYTAMMSVPSEEYLSAIVDQQMGSLDRASHRADGHFDLRPADECG